MMNAWELIYKLQEMHDKLVPREDVGLDVPVYVQVTTHDQTTFSFELKEISLNNGKLILEGSWR
jgi:hypothetical protein